MAAVFNFFPTTLLANRQGSEQLNALSVANSTLSGARARSFSDLKLSKVEHLTEAIIDGVTYRPVLRVQSPDDIDSSNLRLLEVEVFWKQRGQEKSLKQELLVHRVIEN